MTGSTLTRTTKAELGRRHPRRLGPPLRAVRQPHLQRSVGSPGLRQAVRSHRPLVRIRPRRACGTVARRLRRVQRRSRLHALGLRLQGCRARARPSRWRLCPLSSTTAAVARGAEGRHSSCLRGDRTGHGPERMTDRCRASGGRPSNLSPLFVARDIEIDAGHV